MKIEKIEYSDIPVDSKLGKKIAERYLYLKENIEYEEAYCNRETEWYKNISFALNLNGEPVLAVPLTWLKDGTDFSFYSRPIEYLIVDNLKEEERIEVINYYLQVFDRFIDEVRLARPARFTFYADSVLNNHFFNNIDREFSFYNLEGIIDLEIDESLILRNIRKSYRSLINWGKREIRTVLVDDQNPDEQIFNDVREFHIRVAGRETRTKETWDKQFEMIKNKQAYLVVGYFQEIISSAALILYGSKEAYYGVAINDRQMMGDNKPLGHHTVYYAIAHAKSLGLKRFNMGTISSPVMNEKEQQIATFKKGFVSNLESRLIISCKFAQKE
ncbi:MAG: hypothetical protein WC635_16050 [Bacteriovorax sp.]|jgi:hypothetical protein